MNTTALITGASSGLGAEFARIHAARGGNLVLVARRQDRLEQLKSELAEQHGVDITIIAQDLTAPDCAAQIYQACRGRGLEIDYLINNAGFGAYGFFHKVDPDRHEAMIKVNILALTNLTRTFLPAMVQRRRGRIMNVASTAGFVPGPLQSVYYASKAYVISFTRALANELEGTGVTATVLCPGPTETEFTTVAEMGETRLFKLGAASAKSCAEYGYTSMLRGRTVAIHQWKNKMLPQLLRFTPRSLVPRIARYLQEKVR